jgi:hypothetical protein
MVGLFFFAGLSAIPWTLAFIVVLSSALPCATRVYCWLIRLALRRLCSLTTPCRISVFCCCCLRFCFSLNAGFKIALSVFPCACLLSVDSCQLCNDFEISRKPYNHPKVARSWFMVGLFLQNLGRLIFAIALLYVLACVYLLSVDSC